MLLLYRQLSYRKLCKEIVCHIVLFKRKSTGIFPVLLDSLSKIRLKVTSLCLFAFYGFEQCFKVTCTKALSAFALYYFEE